MEAVAGGNLCVIETIPFWQSFRIYALSCVFGAWVLFWRTLRCLWNPNGFCRLQARDNPPACLVDTTLGQHKYVKLKGVKFHYVESGSKNQPLILLLHGFPDCWLTWRHQIPVLAQHFRVVALDLKGFGDSDKPIWRRNYRADLILEELNQLIHALGVSSCTIIGHDLGALLGWYLVHCNPHVVDRFVAVSCPHPNIYWKALPSYSTFNGQWVTFTQLPYLPELDALKEDLSIINQCHKHLDQKYLEGYLEAYKYTFSRKEDWTGPLNYYRNLPFKRIKDKCPQTKVSTLLITGGKDQFVQLEGVVKSTDFCEKSFVKIIDDTGHFPHQEDPEKFNQIVLKYLKVKTDVDKILVRSPSKGLIDSLFGAVTGWNSVLDTVHKRTNGVMSSIPMMGVKNG